MPNQTDINQTPNEAKEIEMLKDGEWVKWDGSDCQTIRVSDQMTLGEIKKNPELYKKLIERYPGLDK